MLPSTQIRKNCKYVNQYDFFGSFSYNFCYRITLEKEVKIKSDNNKQQIPEPLSISD